jgi:SAM-dependent methyltransferase
MFVRPWDLITHKQVPVSPWVSRFARFIPKNSSGLRVLDYACGVGRHSLYLAELGFAVLAVDKDSIALQDLQNSVTNRQLQHVEMRCEDLELERFPDALINEQFAGIVVTNYLFRPHMKQLLDLVVKHGIVIYETFAVGNEAYGKPSNPDFLLKENELLEMFLRQSQFKIIAFESLVVEEPKLAKIQRICAERV